jgi:cellulose synthase/poly-beta-1,6-N-acetylglucosamine synthase-like glycosyltransferase
MNEIFAKTFGGLTRQYLVRQYFFGIVLGGFALMAHMSAPGGWTFNGVFSSFLFTALYPYSRFVYESVVEFIVGDNMFWGNAFLMLSVKLVTMLMCFVAAPLLAPLGLAYLYFANRNR